MSFNNRGTFNFNQAPQKFTNYPETQFIQEDIDLDSSYSVDESSHQPQEQSDSDIPMPPSHKNMLHNLLSSTKYEP